jgi:hypothetical protein
MRILFLFLITCSICPLFSQRIPIQEVMTKEEMKKIGVDSATTEQKAAFEEWLSLWTLRVVEQAPTYRPGENLLLWIQKWPDYAKPTKSKLTKKELEERQRANQRIDKVKNEGATIELKDGSVWQVAPTYTYLSRLWAPGQVIEVGNSEDIRYTRTLKNINRNQLVHANMKAPPSPTGEKQLEDETYYKGSKGVTDIGDRGETLRLEDNSNWQIAPVDQYKVRIWKQNDRIRVEPDDNFLYKYKLTNLDSGQTALANKK